MKKCNANTDYLVGYKVKLYPTESEKRRLNELIDLYRYTYNWALANIQSYYNISDSTLPINDACKLFAEKRNSKEFEWLQGIPINTARHAIMSAYASYSIFFKKKARYPKFKSKKDSKKYFKIRGERIYFYGDFVGFEGLGRNHRILCKNHSVPTGDNIRYYNCSINFDGYNYWLCLSVEIIKYPLMPILEDEPIGIDLGLRKLATLSDGTVYKLPNTDKYIKRMKKLQRQVNKNYRRRLNIANQAKTKLENVEKSKNMIKCNEKLRQVIDRISNIRHTYISTMTRDIVNKHPSTIVLETLNVKGMLKNKYLARHISDSMFSTIAHQLEYKCKEYGIPIMYADRFFPSSQICSCCGNRHNIGRSEIYKCPVCGNELDRDLNAAINLKNLALK